MSTDQRAGNHQSGDVVAGATPARPMPYEPAWYRAAQAEREQRTRDIVRNELADWSLRLAALNEDIRKHRAQEREQDSGFGAVGAMTRLWPAILTAWILIAAMAAFFWLVTP
jgi:hypothetical protein